MAKHPDATSMGKMLLLDSVSGSEMENFTTPTHEKNYICHVPNIRNEVFIQGHN